MLIWYSALDDIGDGIAYDRLNSAGETNSAPKRGFAALVDAEMEDSDADDDLEEGVGAKLTSGDLSFKPLFMTYN